MFLDFKNPLRKVIISVYQSSLAVDVNEKRFLETQVLKKQGNTARSGKNEK